MKRARGSAVFPLLFAIRKRELSFKRTVLSTSGRRTLNSASPEKKDKKYNRVAKVFAPKVKFPSSISGTMNSSSISNTGGTAPHNNMPPYLGINFCIALQGLYPSRS